MVTARQPPVWSQAEAPDNVAVMSCAFGAKEMPSKAGPWWMPGFRRGAWGGMPS